MQRVIVWLLVSLLFYSQSIWATPNKDKAKYKSLRVDHGKKVEYIYGGIIYKIYATSCKIINQPIDSNYIILNPGDPVELKDENGNILILWSLPCK